MEYITRCRRSISVTPIFRFVTRHSSALCSVTDTQCKKPRVWHWVSRFPLPSLLCAGYSVKLKIVRRGLCDGLGEWIILHFLHSVRIKCCVEFCVDNDALSRSRLTQGSLRLRYICEIQREASCSQDYKKNLQKGSRSLLLGPVLLKFCCLSLDCISWTVIFRLFWCCYNDKC